MRDVNPQQSMPSLTSYSYSYSYSYSNALAEQPDGVLGIPEREKG